MSRGRDLSDRVSGKTYEGGNEDCARTWSMLKPLLILIQRNGKTVQRLQSWGAGKDEE